MREPDARAGDPRGTVVDGTGAPAVTADVAVDDGCITAVGARPGRLVRF